MDNERNALERMEKRVGLRRIAEWLGEQDAPDDMSFEILDCMAVSLLPELVKRGYKFRLQPTDYGVYHFQVWNKSHGFATAHSSIARSVTAAIRAIMDKERLP